MGFVCRVKQDSKEDNVAYKMKVESTVRWFTSESDTKSNNSDNNNKRDSHAGLRGNEETNVAYSTDVIAGMAEMLRNLRDFLNKDRARHHGTDCFKERGVDTGSNRSSTLLARKQSLFNHTNKDIISRTTFADS